VCQVCGTTGFASRTQCRIGAYGDAFEDRCKAVFIELAKEFNWTLKRLCPTAIICWFWWSWKKPSHLADCGLFLAIPPGFRPQHFWNMCYAGKTCFMEKPVATIYSRGKGVLAAAQVAKDKSKCCCSLQRHFRQLISCIQIKDIRLENCVWPRYWTVAERFGLERDSLDNRNWNIRCVIAYF